MANEEQADHWNGEEASHWVARGLRYDPMLAPFGAAGALGEVNPRRSPGIHAGAAAGRSVP